MWSGKVLLGINQGLKPNGLQKSKRKVIPWLENITGKRVYKGCDIKFCRNPIKEKEPGPLWKHAVSMSVLLFSPKGPPQVGSVTLSPQNPSVPIRFSCWAFPMQLLKVSGLPLAPPTHPQRITAPRRRCSQAVAQDAPGSRFFQRALGGIAKESSR